MSRHILRHVLNVAGYQVIEACDGAEALDTLDGRPIDLVVSDCNMPEMDGIALIRAARRLSPYRAIPMLIVSSESSEDRKREGLAAGATAWLSKPLQARKILRLIA